MTWYDPLQRQATPFEVAKIWEAALDSWGNFANNIRKIVTAEPCPKCGVMISKNGGCAKVTCGRCHHEFCWLCLGDYYRYSHNSGMEKYCAQTTLMKSSVFIICFSMILLKVLSLFHFNLDAWHSPAMMTYDNVMYYGIITFFTIPYVYFIIHAIDSPEY